MKYKEEEIQKVAARILDEVLSSPAIGGGASLVLLSGELGSGKTTLVKAIAQGLGITETVQSPTYVILRSYKIPTEKISSQPPLSLQRAQWKKMIHIDAYRLESMQEFENLGAQEFLADPKNLVIIEWPERIPKIMERSHVRCLLQHISPIEREITIEVY